MGSLSDSEQVITESAVRTVKIWAVGAGHKVKTLTGHARPIWLAGQKWRHRDGWAGQEEAAAEAEGTQEGQVPQGGRPQYKA